MKASECHIKLQPEVNAAMITLNANLVFACFGF